MLATGTDAVSSPGLLMRVRVCWFGRPTGSPFEAQVAEYRKRVTRRWSAEDLPLKPVAGGRDGDPQRVLAAEARSLARHIPSGWARVALDESGKSLDSEAFARFLAAEEEGGRAGVVFFLGSDIGLQRELKRSCDLRLSLSPMTLPHLLARLLIWEQLFRATHILGGGSYHRR